MRSPMGAPAKPTWPVASMLARRLYRGSPPPSSRRRTRSRPAGSSGLHNSSSSAYVTGERQAPLPNLRRALNASARQRTGYPQLVAAVVEPKRFIGSADQSARQRARLDPSALVGRLANWPAPSRQSASPRGRGRLRRRFGLTTHSTPLPRRSRRGSSPWAASRSFTPTARVKGEKADEQAGITSF